MNTPAHALLSLVALSGGVELILVVGASTLLWRRCEGRLARAFRLRASALYVLVYSGFYPTSRESVP